LIRWAENNKDQRWKDDFCTILRVTKNPDSLTPIQKYELNKLWNLYK